MVMRTKLTALCVLSAALLTNAAVLVDEGFDYGSGVDLNGQGNWVSTNGAFTVDNSELLITADNSSAVLSGADVIPFSAGDTVRMTLDYRIYQPEGIDNQTFWIAGLQGSDVPGETASSHAVMSKIQYSEWEAGTVRSYVDYQDSSVDVRYFAVTTNECGYDPKSIAATDPDSDALQMVYSVTKSGVTNEFYVEMDFINRDTLEQQTISKDVVTCAELWESPQAFFSLNALDAFSKGTELYFDALKIEVLDSVAVAPDWVSTRPGDSEATISWATVPGAGEYLVYRSTVSGSFTDPAMTVYGTTYMDTDLVNDTTYYYVVKSTFYNGDSEASDEAQVTPSTIFVDAPVFTTDFTTYAEGDLADTDDWSELIGSGSNAFAVVVTNADTVADTVATMSDFNATEGNAVYLERLIRNGQDDAIGGYIDVVISATPSAVPEREGTAHFNHQFILDYGLTSTSSDSLKFNKSMMSLFSLKTTFEGHLEIHYEGKKMLRMWRDEANWNPKHKILDGQWASTAGNPLKLYTDPLRITWKIRRTREPGQYQAWTMISNTVTQVAASKDVIEFSLADSQELYDSELAFFAMGHSYNAQASGTAADTDYERDSMLNVTISDVGVTHTIDNAPTIEAPVIADVIGEDRTVLLSWSKVLDATSYTVFLETENGEQYVIADNYTETSLSDGPRWNEATNYYTVRANFDADLTPDFADSEVAEGLPKATVRIVDINGSRSDILSGGDAFFLDQSRVVSNTVSYLDCTEVPMVSHGDVNGAVTYNGPTLYGIVQRTHTNGISSGADRFTFNSNGSVGQKFMLYGGWDADSPRILAYVKVPDMNWEDTAPERIDLTANLLSIYLEMVSWTDGAGLMRAAILNDGQWYVAANGMNLNAGGDPNAAKELRYSSAVDETWNSLNIVMESSMTPGSALADNSVLTDITAVGFFCDRAPYLNLRRFEVQTGGNQSSYEYWSNANGLGSDNSDGSADPDEDGMVNDKEYAFGGDPMDPADQGTLPVMSMANVDGTDYIKYVYRIQRDPVVGVSTQFETTTDLVSIPFSFPDDAIVETETLDYYWDEMTVLIPTDKAKYFLNLNVESN